MLARLEQFIRIARRVIVADADLDHNTLHYLCKLRGETQCFLISNDGQLPGYPVQFLETSDRSRRVDQLLKDVQDLALGQVLYVATDSKGMTKALAQLIATAAPEKRVLVINSDTSGGEREREYIQNPDYLFVNDKHDIIIYSLFVATGDGL